jgi:hypothetical protein
LDFHIASTTPPKPLANASKARLKYLIGNETSLAGRVALPSWERRAVKEWARPRAKATDFDRRRRRQI